MRRKKETFLTKFKNTMVTLLLVCGLLFWVQGYTNASGLKFAQISDAHFLQKSPNTTFKMIAETPNLLDDAIDQVNTTPNVDFVVFTGDLIDKPFVDELNAVIPHVNKLNVPWYFSFGNHDVCIGGYLSKKVYMDVLKENNPDYNFEKPYYSFVPKKGYKVIVLDSNIDTELTSHGYIYPEQLKWLDEELKNSQKDIVLIFMHVPTVEPFPSPNHTMKNAGEVNAIIEKYKNPIGVFTGHYHTTKVIQKGNVLYVSCPSLASYPNAFRMVNITKKRNEVVFDLQFKETRLKNVQKLAKIMVFASSLYAGEEKDRTETYIIKR